MVVRENAILLIVFLDIIERIHSVPMSTVGMRYHLPHFFLTVFFPIAVE